MNKNTSITNQDEDPDETGYELELESEESSDTDFTSSIYVGGISEGKLIKKGDSFYMSESSSSDSFFTFFRKDLPTCVLFAKLI